MHDFEHDTLIGREGNRSPDACHYSMLILALASLSVPLANAIQPSPTPSSPDFSRLLQFDLSHQFTATSRDTDESPLLSDHSFPQHFHPTLSLKAVPTTVYRPTSDEALQHARWRSIHQAQSEPVEWTESQILGPDVTDKRTLAQLARMAANAYQLPGKENWYELDPSWNTNTVSRHASTTLQSTSECSVELSLWLGRRREWVPRLRVPLPRQLHRHTVDKRHHATRSHVQQGQAQ